MRNHLTVLFFILYLLVGCAPKGASNNPACVGTDCDAVTNRGYSIDTILGFFWPTWRASGSPLLVNMSNPAALTFDAAGNLYIADSSNQIIRKVDATSGLMSTVVGTGASGYAGDGGPALLARLNYPNFVAVDSSGNLFIADTNNHVIRKVTASTGLISTLVGTGASGYSGDGGPAANAKLNSPNGVLVDSSGNLYIADSSNNVVRYVDQSTKVITTIAGTGTAGATGNGGLATAATLNYPATLAMDSAGNLYIGDYLNGLVRRVASGTQLISTFAGGGAGGDGTAAATASLVQPWGIFVDAGDNVYISDASNNRIRKVTFGSGLISTVAGNGGFGYSGDGASATAAHLRHPQNAILDASGNLFIADTYNEVVRKVDVGTGNISTVVGTGSLFTEGVATQSQANYPYSVAVDSQGNLFAAYYLSHVVVKVTQSTHSVSVYAGTGATGNTGDGGQATSATLFFPNRLAIDSHDNLYIYNGQTKVVRKVDKGTGLISTYAGNGTAGYSGDGGLATNAKLGGFVDGLAFDKADNLYIGDTSNHIIRMVNGTTGLISTIAGTVGVSGYSGDGGPARNAKLYSPIGLHVDSNGNLYVAEYNNQVIRKIDASTQIISTVAGTGVLGFSGDGGVATAAKFKGPNSVKVDKDFNLYITDGGNNVVRFVNASSGIISTIAGTGVRGYSGDGGAALTAEITGPTDLVLNSDKSFFITDPINNLVRQLSPP